MNAEFTVRTLKEAIQRNLDDGWPIEKQTLLLPHHERFDTTIETEFGALKVKGTRYLNSAALVRDQPTFFDFDWTSEAIKHLRRNLSKLDKDT